MEVTGPAELDLFTPMHLRVLRGSVTADIGDGLKGFVIDTPEARVVDLGTRFAVSAGGANGTQVAVLDGKVEVYESSGDHKDSGPQVTLNEGEGIRIDTLKKPQRLGMVRLNSNARTLRDGSDIDLVSDVWDNRGIGGGTAFTALCKGVWVLVPGLIPPGPIASGGHPPAISFPRNWKVLIKSAPSPATGPNRNCVSRC